MEDEIEKHGKFSINTSSAYYLVKQHQDDEDIPHKNLVEFRERLEDILPRYAQPSAKFHPLSWKYQREKYQQWQPVKDYWKMKDSNVFDPYFFMSDARISGEVTYHSLTNDEKEEVDKSLKEEGEDLLVRWAYDSYALWDNCPLTYQKHEEDFEFFFVWQLLLSDLQKIKGFLNWHLRNTFQNNLVELKDFVEVMYIKYDRILSSEKNRKVTFGFLEKMMIEPIPIKMTISEIGDDAVNQSKRKTKNKIEIPITIERRNTDKYTQLTVSQTAILFDYLSKVESILSEEKHEEFLKKINKAKAIQVLTGYKFESTTDAMEENIQKKKPNDIREVRKIINEIKILIDKDLK